MVAVALAGAVLPNGLEIKEAEIRGEKSYGMICAEDELGLGKNHEGIMVLNSKAKIGQPLAAYLKTEDIVLEIDNKSLSNRPDLLNHYGLARELSAIFNLPLKDYDKFFNSDQQKIIAGLNEKKSGRKKSLAEEEIKAELEVKVEADELCPRYLALRVDNIKIEESPAWLKERLTAVGQRPINNIVDLTNYVMFDCGQPLHAFDADKVKKIMVRRAHPDEIIETLDEKERSLNEDNLLISDGQKALAIAGVMGGRESEISAETKAIILEAANFEAATVRKTSQKLGLRTESSLRFEKSLDPQLPPLAVARFLVLLKKVCPEMKISSRLVDINNTKNEIKNVELDLNWLEEKIGQEIPRGRVSAILERLGFTVLEGGGDLLKINIPSWRATKDVSGKEDVAEEILRLYGYDNIASCLPALTIVPPEINEERRLERKIKNILALKHSLNESYNYSFVSEDWLGKLGIDFLKHLHLANPLSEEQTLLRQSLVPGLTGNVKSNQAKSDNFGFFEFGSVFFNALGDLRKDTDPDSRILYQEKRLGLVLADDKNEPFGRLKGIISGLFQELIAYDFETEFLIPDIFPAWADQTVAAKIMLFGEEIGLVAKLSDQATANLNLKKKVALAELNFTRLAEILSAQPTAVFKESPRYPALVRDLAFVIEERIGYNELKREIAAFDPLIKEIELFDVYSGIKLPVGKKSLAFHLSFCSEEKTLTAAEVDKIQEKLVAHLAEKFEAQLRDF